MTVPAQQVRGYIDEAIRVAVQRVTERADELFTSEIASEENGTASPFQKMLFPEAKVFSSFERSLSASLGKAFDYVGAAIARATYGNGEHDYSITGPISRETLGLIEHIVNSYRPPRGSGNKEKGVPPDTEKEMLQLAPLIEGTNPDLLRTAKSDVFFIDHEGYENYLEIKTPMPNYDTCAAMKTRILTLRALRHAHKVKVRALAVFPHNPNGLAGTYAWPPLRYFLDPKHDWSARGKLLMGAELWNFIGNSPDTYDELLGCFYEVSLARKDELLALLTTAVR